MTNRVGQGLVLARVRVAVVRRVNDRAQVRLSGGFRQGGRLHTLLSFPCSERLTDPAPEGLAQLDSYLDRFRLDHGTLVVFDRRPPSPALPPLPGRISFSQTQTPAGRQVTLLRA